MAKGGYICIEYALPSGYTRVEYIQSSGTQYIDTVFKANQDTKVVMRVALVGTVTSQVTLFGGRTGANEKAFALAYTGQNGGYYRYFYNNQYDTTSLTGDPNKIRVIVAEKNTVDIGDNSYSWTYGNFQCDYTMYLLATNAAGTANWIAKAKLYSCQIYDNGTLVRDFVPCTNPSGVAGLYDVVNGVFYTDAAGGTFTAGSSVPLSVARKISKVYIGVGGVARKVKKAYIGDENGLARLWFVNGVPISTLAVGSSVFMNVNGVRTEFLVVHQGIPSTAYDSSCDGTWLLLKYVSYDSPIYRSWGVSGDDYENSDIHEYLNNTFINYFDGGIKGAIKQVKIPYTKGVGTSTLANGANGLSAKLFLLSEEEVHSSTHSGNYNEGTTLSYFKSGEKEARLARDSTGGGPYKWHTRTIEKNKNYPMVASFGYDGIQSWSSPSETSKNCNRFALILPSETLVDEDFNVIA